MTRHECRTDPCGVCVARIDAAEDAQTYDDPAEADAEADRYFG